MTLSSLPIPRHTARGRHRTGARTGATPPRRTRRGFRALAGSAALLTVTGVAVALAPSAAAALGAAGPENPQTLFPDYYTDTNGLALQMCQDGAPLCLAGPESIEQVHAAGGDAEAFYWAADAEAGPFALHDALEAAYADVGANQEAVFQRTQVTARDGGLVPNATYRVTDPYGSFTCTADALGFIQQNACRIETPVVARDFNGAVGGRMGPFLLFDPAVTPAAPAGFIGDNVTPHKVIGSPTGFNAFRVSGPGLTGTCTNADLSTVSNCVQSDLFIVQGKLKDLGQPVAALSAGTLDFGDIPATPAVTKALTYANTGTVPVAIASVTTTGAGAAAFAVTNACPATVAVGGRCTINVTFTPVPGASSAATLTITDNTVASPRAVALKGSNLPNMVVLDPVPPAALAFGSVPVGSTSAEINALLGNTGNGPLTIASIALTGASAAQFGIGPNNTAASCVIGTPVPSDGGCEVGVVFRPISQGGKSANLRVTDSNGKIVNVPLTGTGAAAPADTTAPTVTARAPAANATNVAVGSNVTATFSENVTGVSGTTFTLLRGTTAVAATVSYNATTRVATLDPSANLANSTVYTARLNVGSTGIQDAAANPLAATSWTFTTAAAPNPAPTVTARAPALDATAVGQASNVTATFSEAVNGVSATTFVLRNATTNATIGAVVSRNGTTNQWILNPNANLAADTRYTATLTGGATAIRDLAGAPLATTSWSFTTGPAPTVTARTPANGAVGVSRTANVTATFSENVTNVSGTTFILRVSATGASVLAVVSYNATTRVATLNPNATLAANTQYSASLTPSGTTRIRDAAGNPLAINSWAFTTGP